MFRYLFSSRAIQIGLVFFVIVVTGSLLYNWHVQRTIENGLPASEVLLQHSESQNETRTTQDTVDTSTVDFGQTETPRETDETQLMSDEMETLLIDEVSEPFDIADAFLPEDFVSEELAEVPVSPFGFGPYPEVPAGLYLSRHGRTVWQDPGRLPLSSQRYIELINRVMIASWNEGDTHFTSATFENGRVYLQYPNTMYVRYAVRERSDGTVQRRITSWTSGEHNQSAIDQILEGKIPTGVTLIDMDSEDVGIDPYTFLGLE